VKTQKYENDRQLKFKINIIFYGDNSWTVALRRTKFGKVKDHGIPTSLICIIFFNRRFEYSDVGILKLLRWIQNLHQTMWDHEILYADRSSRGKQLSMRTPFQKTKSTNMMEQLKVNIHILFYGQNSWTVELRQIKFCALKDHGHTYKFYLIHYFLWQSFWIRQ
jgi:hypothetical protein